MKQATIAAAGIVLISSLTAARADSGDGWVSYPGGKGPGAGKKIVLLAGDEEYRSEEALPMLAKILSVRHGFQCTVLFSTGADGVIDPNNQQSINRPEALDSADAIVTSLRFRKWPDAAMKHFDGAVQRGVPIVGLRTSTHSFQQTDASAYKRYNNYGKEILGENWVNHWGRHGQEATRGIVEPSNKSNPLLNGVSDVFGATDVYEAYPPADATILLRGEVLAGMTPDSKPASYEKTRAKDGGKQDVNSPMMPVAWSREVKNPSGTTNRVLCTTMGAASDLTNEGLRRLIVNGVYWGLKMEVPAKADVRIVGEYKPSKYEFNGYKKGVKAADLELKD
jgi:type 1 glutamine amidotransferase